MVARWALEMLFSVFTGVTKPLGMMVKTGFFGSVFFPCIVLPYNPVKDHSIEDMQGSLSMVALITIFQPFLSIF